MLQHQNRVHMANIAVVAVLSDNYAYLVHDQASGATAVIDPSEAQPVLAALKEKGWKATHLINTHHHFDHVGGNLEVKEAAGCRVIGSESDASRIPGIDQQVKDRQTLQVGSMPVEILHIPGHTLGHIALWFKEQQAVFTGDTLFALGCGRVFEGTHDQMWRSLCRLRDLPGPTRVYCGHEYAQKNARFALTVEPDNEALKIRSQQIDALRAQGKPAVPAAIETERQTNPFLRVDSAEDFAWIRRKKDAF